MDEDGYIEREGFGIIQLSNKNTYEGFWSANKKNGIGFHRYRNGNYYVGEFTDDLAEGFGQLSN